MHEELRLYSDIVEPLNRVPRLLNDPFLVGMIGDRPAKDLASAQMNEDEEIGIELSVEGVDAFREEIAGDETLQVRVDKCFPRNMASTFSFRGFGKDILRFENVAYRRDSYTETQLFEFSDNSAATPSKTSAGKSAHQITNLSSGGGPTKLLEDVATRTASQPSLVGLGSNNMDDVELVMVQKSAHANQLSPFLRRRDNAARVDARAPHANLKFEHLDSCVVPWPKPLAHHRNECINGSIHRVSFPHA